MSPEERRAVAVLARLREEIAAERAVLARCQAEALGLLGRAPEVLGRSELIHLAALIHAYYTAFEALVERVVRQLDLEVPSGDRWHEELLVQAAVDLPGVRPAIIDGSLRVELDALRRFRHFFRHAYGLELDPGRVHAEGERLIQIDQRLTVALDRFLAFLSGAVDELAEEAET